MSTQPSPVWAKGLVKNGTYFEGFVENLDVLEHHKQVTITTWGIRRSRTNNGEKRKEKVCSMVSYVFLDITFIANN